MRPSGTMLYVWWAVLCSMFDELQSFMGYLRQTLVFMLNRALWEQFSFGKILLVSLFLIITFGFTCGEREICSTIKKFQNIMNMIAEVIVN